MKPVITRMVVSTSPARKKPKAGDTKMIGGVLHVRQQERCASGPYKGALIVSNGRPVYEWVPASQESAQSIKDE